MPDDHTEVQTGEFGDILGHGTSPEQLEALEHPPDPPDEPLRLVAMDWARKQTFTARVDLLRTGDNNHWQHTVTRVHRYTDRPAIWSILEELKSLPEETVLAFDASGIGDVIVADARRMGLRPEAVVITGGGSAHEHEAEPDTWLVAEQILIQLLRQRLGRQLTFRCPPEQAALLATELTNYTYQLTDAGNLVYHARPGTHDDILMALAIGVFVAERHTKAVWLTVTPEMEEEAREYERRVYGQNRGYSGLGPMWGRPRLWDEW